MRTDIGIFDSVEEAEMKMRVNPNLPHDYNFAEPPAQVLRCAGYDNPRRPVMLEPYDKRVLVNIRACRHDDCPKFRCREEEADGHQEDGSLGRPVRGVAALPE